MLPLVYRSIVCARTLPLVHRSMVFKIFKFFFRTEFNAQQLLLVSFLDILRIFGSVETYSESTLPFLYILMFTFFACFNGGPWFLFLHGSYLSRFSINFSGCKQGNFLQQRDPR